MDERVMSRVRLSELVFKHLPVTAVYRYLCQDGHVSDETLDCRITFLEELAGVSVLIDKGLSIINKHISGKIEDTENHVFPADATEHVSFILNIATTRMDLVSQIVLGPSGERMVGLVLQKLGQLEQGYQYQTTSGE